jgi:hypothetical protein
VARIEVERVAGRIGCAYDARLADATSPIGIEALAGLIVWGLAPVPVREAAG